MPNGKCNYCELCKKFDELNTCNICKIQVCRDCYSLDNDLCYYCGTESTMLSRLIYKCDGYNACGTEIRFPVDRVPDEFDCPSCGLKTNTKTYRFLQWIKHKEK